MLHVEGLTKRYGKCSAIEDVSFCVHPNEVVGLVGHNGSGKSTIMNIVTGYLAQTAGTVTLNGKDASIGAADARKKTGYLPETPALYTNMTVEEQLRFAAGLKGVRSVRGELERVCALAKIAPVRGRLIANLSKGYRQRVGLAQAMIGNPALLVLDEPASGLDPAQMIQMREMIGALKQSHAILMSSHVLQEMSLICDKLVVLSNGRVVADESPDVLRRRCGENDVYQVTIAGEREAIEQAVASLENISCVECDAAGEYIKIRMRIDGNYPAERLSAVLAETGAHLSTVEPIVPDLEQAYLALTQDKRYAREE